MIQRIVAARMEPGFRLRLAFADGAEGTVDLSPRVAGGIAYVAIGAPPEAVEIGPGGRLVAWRGPENEALCFGADALRMEMEQPRAVPVGN